MDIFFIRFRLFCVEKRLDKLSCICYNDKAIVFQRQQAGFCANKIGSPAEETKC